MELNKCEFGKDILEFNTVKEFNVAIFSNEFEVTVNELLLNIFKLFIANKKYYETFKKYCYHDSFTMSSSDKEKYIESFTKDIDTVTYEICLHIFHRYFFENLKFRFTKHAFSRLISRFGRRDIDRLRNGIHTATKAARKNNSDYIILKNIVFIIDLKRNEIVTCYMPGVFNSFIVKRFGSCITSKNRLSYQLDKAFDKIQVESRGGLENVQ